MLQRVLISAQPQTIVDDVREFVRALGYLPIDHHLGSVPTVELKPLSFAMICPSDNLEPAIAQTKRWRVELGDHYVPILWFLDRDSPEWARAGLEAGADLCHSVPWDADLLTAQLRPLHRVRRAFDRFLQKEVETRAIAERLAKAYEQTDRDIDLARTIHRTLVPRLLPEQFGFRFGVHHRPRSRAGGDFFEAWAAGNDLEFFLADAIGSTGAAGSLFGLYVKQLISAASVRGAEGAISPGELLQHVNRSLLKLNLDEPPLVSLVFVRVTPTTRKVAFARAGMPHPIHCPLAGAIEPWTTPGPFLGVAEAEYPTHYGQLDSGDKLIFASDGTSIVGNDGRPNSSILMRAVETHRELAAAAFVDAVANAQFRYLIPTDDFTLLAIEHIPETAP